MSVTTVFRILPALALTLAVAACGDDETSPTDEHTPAAARVFHEGVEVTDPMTFTVGAIVRLEVRFYDAADQEMTDIETEHFASLNFEPSGLAVSQTDVTGHHFQKFVTFRSEPGAGTYSVGFGHDEAADQVAFGPFEVALEEVPEGPPPGPE